MSDGIGVINKLRIVSFTVYCRDCPIYSVLYAFEVSNYSSKPGIGDVPTTQCRILKSGARVQYKCGSWPLPHFLLFSNGFLWVSLQNIILRTSVHFVAVLTLFVIPLVEKLGTHFTLAPLTANQKKILFGVYKPLGGPVWSNSPNGHPSCHVSKLSIKMRQRHIIKSIWGHRPTMAA